MSSEPTWALARVPHSYCPAARSETFYGYSSESEIVVRSRDWPRLASHALGFPLVWDREVRQPVLSVALRTPDGAIMAKMTDVERERRALQRAHRVAEAAESEDRRIEERRQQWQREGMYLS
jgi:hypothetical protein